MFISLVPIHSLYIVLQRLRYSGPNIIEKQQQEIFINEKKRELSKRGRNEVSNEKVKINIMGVS